MNKIFNNKQLLVIFLLSIFAAGMLYMLVWLLSQVRLCWSSEEWPETKGTITQVEYRRKSAGSGIHGTYVNLDIDVRFEWKSKMYHTGNQGCSFDIPYKKLHVGKKSQFLSMKIILTSLFYQKASRDGSGWLWEYVYYFPVFH